jgi:multisubunit Na+/H+ antiporter MnhC subunit
MPIENILVLSGIVIAFASFVVTLAWVSRHDGEPTPAKARQAPRPVPMNARHA